MEAIRFSGMPTRWRAEGFLQGRDYTRYAFGDGCRFRSLAVDLQVAALSGTEELPGSLCGARKPSPAPSHFLRFRAARLKFPIQIRFFVL